MPERASKFKPGALTVVKVTEPPPFGPVAGTRANAYCWNVGILPGTLGVVTEIGPPPTAPGVMLVWFAPLPRVIEVLALILLLAWILSIFVILIGKPPFGAEFPVKP